MYSKSSSRSLNTVNDSVPPPPPKLEAEDSSEERRDSTERRGSTVQTPDRRGSTVTPDRRGSTVLTPPDRKGSTVLAGPPSVPEYASSSLLEERRLSGVAEEKDKPLEPLKLELQREDSEVQNEHLNVLFFLFRA